MDENLNEDIDSTNDVNVEETTNEEVETLSYEEAQKLRESNRKLYERTKKAEEEAKALKAKASPQITNDQQLSEELKLIARGLSDEEIDQAKILSKGTGVSLTEAIKNPLFTLYQDNLKEERRKEDAKLGASRGSSESQEEISGLEAGSSRDEHKKAAEKLLKNIK